MKKIAMTICGIAFISMMALAQGVDSTNNRNGSTGVNDNNTQDSALNQSADPQSIEGTPRTQDPTNSPTTQPLPQQQSQPQLQSPPLETQPQVPTQSQPTVDPNSPARQDQLNEPIQPTQPVQPVQPVKWIG